MFCKYCGKQIPDMSKFCTACGKSLTPQVEPNKIRPKVSDTDSNNTLDNIITTEKINDIKTEPILTSTQESSSESNSTTSSGPAPTTSPNPGYTPNPGENKKVVSLPSIKLPSTNIIFIGIIGFLVIIIIIMVILFFVKKPDNSNTDQGENISASADISSAGNTSSALVETKTDSSVSQVEESIDYQAKFNEYWESVCVDISSALDRNAYDEARNILYDANSYFESLVNDTNYDGLINFELISSMNSYINNCQIDFAKTKIDEFSTSGNQADMDEYLTIIFDLLSYDDYLQIHDKAYTKLTLTMVNNMPNQGYGTADILAFLDDQLSLTGYACWIIEYWDFYYSVYMAEKNVQEWSTSVSHLSPNKYLIDDSNVRLIDESDIKNLTRYELSLARFEIYARHGRTFSDAAVNKHFNQFAWYNGTIAPNQFDENVLSSIEKQNIIFIISYEISKGYRNFDTMNITYKPQKTTAPSSNNAQASNNTPAKNNASVQPTNVPFSDFDSFISDKWFNQIPGEFEGHGTGCSIKRADGYNVKIRTNYWAGLSGNETTMTGTYDPVGGYITYSDAVSKSDSPTAEGDRKEWIDYTNGSGYFYISGNTLYWVKSNGSSIEFTK